MTRIAVSIQTLTDEVHARSPKTTVYHYDNGPRRDSDHDPNDYGVICACDIMQGHGLDLHALSREIVAARHPECAYVIFNKQIASRNTGWEWDDYHGESNHTDHIHVSAGVGRDGYKKPPYDSTRPWLGDGMNPYVQHVMNYRLEAVVAMREIVKVPTFTVGSKVYPAFSEPNVLAITLKASGNPDIDEAALPAHLEPIMRDIMADIEAENPTDGLTAAEVTAAVEDALNRSKIVVTPTA